MTMEIFNTWARPTNPSTVRKSKCMIVNAYFQTTDSLTRQWMKVNKWFVYNSYNIEVCMV